MPKTVDLFTLPSGLNAKTGLLVEKRHGREDFYSQIHRHDFFELELIIEGGGSQRLNGETYPLQRGCVSILRPADLHEVHFFGPTVYYNISFSEQLLHKELLQSVACFRGDLFTRLEGNDFEVATLLLQALLKAQYPAPDTAVIRRMLDALLLTVRKKLNLTRQMPVDVQGLQAALTFLQIHFMENPSLQQVAKIAHYNASHFSACFHREMKQTYSQYLNRLKINYAKNLLLTTGLKVSQIGLECGFCSESNFLRVFKAVTGTSPHAFRRNGLDRKGPEVLAEN